MNLKVLLVRFAMTQHKSQKGFLTFAQNTDSVDYLRLAYLQAMNIKSTQKSAEYAVIVDKATALLVTEQHRRVFDYVIELTDDFNDPASQWKLLNEWQVFWLTPFKETIKLESDILFSRDIDHWWNTFRLKDVVLSTGCKNYLGKKSDVRKYRQLFDDNDLPDVYNGIMYFRYSKTAADFFTLAKRLTLAWSDIKDQILKNCREDKPSTDVLYAVITEIIGRELCTIPSADFINFVHMKPGINGWDDNRSWQDSIIGEFDGDIIRVNNINQYYPVHYFDKKFATDELIKYYEQRS